MRQDIFYLIFFLVSTGTISASNAQEEFRDDYVLNENAEGWLKVHTTPATFRDAHMRCDCEGAVLASPLNENLRTALTAVHPNNSHECGMLTGIHSSIALGEYSTVEGIPLSRLSVTWAANEPDSYGQKACVVMLPAGALAAVRCDEPFPFVCYKRKIKVLKHCGSSDYTLDERTGSCYKFHRVGKTWRRGQMTCLEEGGQLAVINSATEATVLKELFAKNPENSIEAAYNYVAAIGFLDWGGSGKWYTLEGKTLEQSGYSKWSPGQPDHMVLNGQGSHCGAIFRSGELDDLWCDGPNLAFICEKAPVSVLAGGRRQ